MEIAALRRGPWRGRRSRCLERRGSRMRRPPSRRRRRRVAPRPPSTFFGGYKREPVLARPRQLIFDFSTMETAKKDPGAAREDSPQSSPPEEKDLLPPPPKRGCLTRIVDHPERPPIVSHRHTWTSDALGEGRSLVTTLSNRGLGFSRAISSLKKKQVRAALIFCRGFSSKKSAPRRSSGPSTGSTRSPPSSPTSGRSRRGERSRAETFFRP